MVRFFSAMDKSCLRGCVVDKLFNVAEFSDEGAMLVVLFLLLRDREKEEEKEEEEGEESNHFVLINFKIRGKKEYEKRMSRRE